MPDDVKLRECPFCGSSMPATEHRAGHFMAQCKCGALGTWNTPDPSEQDVERVREELELQMEWDQNDLPSSLQREAGLVWLEGWFNLRAAINALKGEIE